MGRPATLEECDKVCPVCKKVFHCTTHYQIVKQEVCSRQCRTHGNGRPVEAYFRPCGTCEKPMRITPCFEDTKHYCSYKCAAAAKPSGSDNPAWKGGNSFYWKKKCRERDNWTCRRCGSHATGKRFHAHHIIPRGFGGVDTLDNLVGLCNVCHAAVEKEFYSAIVSLIPAGKLATLVSETKKKYQVVPPKPFSSPEES